MAVYGTFRLRPQTKSRDERAYRERSYHFVAEPADEGLVIGDSRGVLDLA